MQRNRKLTLQAFSEEVGYSCRQLNRFINAGKLIPRRTLGGRPFYLDKDIAAFIEFESKNSFKDDVCLDLTEI